MVSLSYRSNIYTKRDKQIHKHKRKGLPMYYITITHDNWTETFRLGKDIFNDGELEIVDEYEPLAKFKTKEQANTMIKTIKFVEEDCEYLFLVKKA